MIKRTSLPKVKIIFNFLDTPSNKRNFSKKELNENEKNSKNNYLNSRKSKKENK